MVFLDRDGVLNEIVVHPELGTIDSPMNPSEVKIKAGVPEALRQLQASGFLLIVVSNQPAAAKGKTTWDLLAKTHESLIEGLRAEGVQIVDSFLCPHKSEDQCACRKPKTGLFEQAEKKWGPFDSSQSWMVGDSATDVEAGTRFGVKTVFLGPRKCDACKVLESYPPTMWKTKLGDFVTELTGRKV